MFSESTQLWPLPPLPNLPSIPDDYRRNSSFWWAPFSVSIQDLLPTWAYLSIVPSFHLAEIILILYFSDIPKSNAQNCYRLIFFHPFAIIFWWDFGLDCWCSLFNLTSTSASALHWTINYSVTKMSSCHIYHPSFQSPHTGLLQVI